MDFNPVENLIRPLALNRKNSLFAGHYEGAHNWVGPASLIATCKLNGIEPFAYMKATIEALVAGHRNAEYRSTAAVEFQGAARCGCDVTSLYPQTCRHIMHKALQHRSSSQMMFAARAAKTAGVNRKSHVIQTPLTSQLQQ